MFQNAFQFISYFKLKSSKAQPAGCRPAASINNGPIEPKIDQQHIKAMAIIYTFNATTRKGENEQILISLTRMVVQDVAAAKKLQQTATLVDIEDASIDAINHITHVQPIYIQMLHCSSC